MDAGRAQQKCGTRAPKVQGNRALLRLGAKLQPRRERISEGHKVGPAGTWIRPFKF